MGKMQRTKGYLGEREIVNLLNELGVKAKRVPLSGATDFQKDDVLLEDGGTIEVKRRKRVPAIVREMLVSADYGAVREDRGEWLVVMSLKEFAYIFKRYLEKEQELQKGLTIKQLPGFVPEKFAEDNKKDERIGEVAKRILIKNRR